MKIQAFTQPRPMPDRIYTKTQDAEFRAHADSYVQERDQVASRAMSRGFFSTGGVTTAVGIPVLVLAAQALGVPRDVALVSSGLAGLAVGSLAGLASGTVAADKATREYDAHNARPVLTVERWDTYVGPYHDLLTLDDLRP
ncbi:MAG: hypothetical protein KF760_12550 [Candidatus Eremiobacteraeota bacterium]|nr:hypothetical protein [Candidatus Eremiobacteraeota bacterium]MCW5871684.1 hypothetical protein [Candidatus Eremiobacteraeota bacterium]